MLAATVDVNATSRLVLLDTISGDSQIISDHKFAAYDPHIGYGVLMFSAYTEINPLEAAEEYADREIYIHDLETNTILDTINKIEYLQSVLTKKEDEIQLYINLDNDIPSNFLDTFKVFDKHFPDIRLRIYPDSIKTFGGDPIEYWNEETAVMKKMRTIVNSTNNYDIKALYKELCEKFKNYQ